MEAIKYKESNQVKNSAISTFIHDLRTPIAAIKGYSTMMLDYFPALTAKEAKEYIQSIDNATDKLTELINNLAIKLNQNKS